MEAIAVASLVSGVILAFIGVLVVSARVQLLAFVRKRFEKVHREDDLSDDEILRRSPKMSAVVIIGLGCVAFGIAQIVYAALSTILRPVGS